MKIKIKKGTRNWVVRGRVDELKEKIVSKTDPLFYSWKMGHYTDELQGRRDY